ncbi:MAG: SAM-dependent methyltransferase [Acidobacteria bacterium]|nr:SAM-dependent methyltransferase [Acidobacteriota bacterium]
MEPDCRALLVDRIRHAGPITVAEFMEVALYAPGAGYYARAVQRSGRAGDFVTSVDVGPLFGELLALQIADFSHRLQAGSSARLEHVHVVEAGAGNGRLARDVLDALRRREPALYDTIRLHLVERSEAARAAQLGTLGPHASRMASSSRDLPDVDAGVLVANELLDAFPVHLVVMTPAGLGEIYVDADGDSLVERLGPPSTERLAQYFEDLGIALHAGAAVDVNLAAIDWIRDVSRHLARGFVILIDYGYEAQTMYAGPNAVGTLTAFSRHMADPPAAPDHRMTSPASVHHAAPSWLVAPGTRDLTTHVDFTTLRREAARVGLATLSLSSQSRFLLNLVERGGLIGDLERPDRLRDRLALKSLLVPGALGSSHSVLVLGKSGEGGVLPPAAGIVTAH